MDLSGVKAIHPQQRISVSPCNGKQVSSNPPALLWPVTRGKDVRYSVRLSRSAEFDELSTIQAASLRWAMFNPHKKIAVGTWYWQYGVNKAGESTKWSETSHFEVTEAAKVYETPTAAEVIQACPKDHPRLWVTADELEGLRERVRNSEELVRFTKSSRDFFGEELQGDAEPPKKGVNEYQTRTYRRWASKALAGKISGSIQWLVPTYLMTGDEKYAREAIRRALHVARWDPDGFTAPSASDFADGSCMRIMAQAYDSCFHLLSEEERALLREAMATRARRFFESTTNNLESRVFSAHIWQHILLEFAEVAFATLHEIPEAEAWASYIYELWLARFPLMGGADGGWANGNNYFGTNIETMLSIPSLFRRLAGIDLFEDSWYRSAPEFLIHTWPPHSQSDGFGDGGEKVGFPSDARLAFSEALGKVHQNPYALWYVQESLKGKSRSLSLSPMLAWYRIHSSRQTDQIQPKSPGNLPQAKAFRDVGIVSMHTDLADASHDLMIGFRSSPYGSFNHAHACQNSFNILYGGERVFSNSGYYIAYGDDHFKGWYTHTRGHNSVLIDGKGQTQASPEGYGWIPQFLHGQRISYCAGDASNAYGDAGLTKFRRHLVLLRPSTIVIYDEMEADHPANWDWLLHSPQEMTSGSDGLRMLTETSTARAHVDIMGTGSLHMEINDQFDPPALNWRGRKVDGKIPKEFPDQWHARISPGERSSVARFLAVIQIRASTDQSPFHEVVFQNDGEICIGDWRIKAVLDASRDAALLVQRLDEEASLATGWPTVTLGEDHYEAEPDGSILVEKLGSEILVRRSIDELPQAVCTGE
ncbi:DUF4962 domain-containing protein [Candidatus Poribacteria bacterium]